EDDPDIGTILLHEDLPPDEGQNDANRRRAERVITTMEALDCDFVAKGSKPIALISAQSYGLTEFSRAARARFPRIACLNEPDRAFRTLAQIKRYRDLMMREDEPDTGAALPEAKLAELAGVLRAAGAASDGAVALNEPQSKAVLRAYGMPIPDEMVVATADEAVAAARRIGYPVVLKAVASALTHKSDAGAVKTGLGDESSVRVAYQSIKENLAAYDGAVGLEGFLVAAHVGGGLELVLGVHRDPEMGPVVMFGAGGVLLELTRDVAFAPPGLTRADAGRLVDETKAGVLLGGYRGEGAYERDAVLDALVALGRLAADLGDDIESVDINPFIALPRGQGAFALDALVIARGTRLKG
ncbi:MAG: acetate--CoA ligase family protein, partial [Alphaproteobacteria bacterium]